jgi:hypothetical protein
MKRRAAVVAQLIVLLGCGGPGPRLVPVTGRVLFRDHPLAGALVEFIPEGGDGARPSSRAHTNHEGEFTLRCPPYGPGAVGGRHRVTVVVYPGAPGPPARYANPRRTPLRVDVPEGGVHDLELRLEGEDM